MAMKFGGVAASVFLALGVVVAAHDRGLSITWNREISRIVYDRCASCHRPEGSAFSLMTYVDAQPRTDAIKESVLSRRMPPWGAVKGFGNFRNDEGLTQEQIELITRWVDGGARRGNNPRMLPKPPTFEMPEPFSFPTTAIPVSGPLELSRDTTLDGLLPEKVPPGRSMQIVAALPTGSIEPLLWLYEYDDRYRHPFLLRRPIHLPAGTIIQGVPADAVVALIPVQK
ncbi:MAG: c-type cytochrome [Vicinamibacterales bacterium]